MALNLFTTSMIFFISRGIHVMEIHTAGYNLLGNIKKLYVLYQTVLQHQIIIIPE